MSKYEQIKRLCAKKGVTVSKAEEDCGFAKGSLSKIDKHRPSYRKLAILSKYFSTPIFSMFIDDESDIEIINEYQTRFDKELDNDLIESAKNVLMRPISVYEVAAGDGRYNEENATEIMNPRFADYKDDEHAYIKVCGDSMSPQLIDGDILRIHYQTETAPTDLTVLKINGEKETIKLVEVVENGVWVRALNKEVFEDRFYSVQEVMNLPIQIIGKAVEIAYREL